MEQPKTRALVNIGTHFIKRNDHEETDANKIPPLGDQLSHIPATTETLTIDNDTPSDADWSLLSTHFFNVKDLQLSSGWNEALNDNIPAHWPLQRLVINSACGELVATPWIVKGKVKTLRFEWTMGLRFEGPTNKELLTKHSEQVEKGEKEEVVKNGIKFIYLPELVRTWLWEKYADASSSSSSPGEEEKKNKGEDDGDDETQSNLETLEIVENDAHDLLFRLVLSRDEIFAHIESLYLRATNGCDFHYSQDILVQLLPQLTSLKQLTLVLGNEYADSTLLTELYRSFPKALETLQFRSMVGLARSQKWEEWVKAFADPTFLPGLKTVGFVLDLRGNVIAKTSEGGESVEVVQVEEKYGKASDEDLAFAKRACERLWKAAEGRDVVVVPFVEPVEGIERVDLRVDERWDPP